MWDRPGAVQGFHSGSSRAVRKALPGPSTARHRFVNSLYKPLPSPDKATNEHGSLAQGARATEEDVLQFEVSVQDAMPKWLFWCRLPFGV